MTDARILKLEMGIRPPASPSCRLFEPEAGGAKGAYAQEGKIGRQMSGFIFTQST
jgi:hypothetical protein